MKFYMNHMLITCRVNTYEWNNLEKIYPAKKTDL